MNAAAERAPRLIGAAEVDAALDYPALIEALRAAFREPIEAPPRHHHTIRREGRPDATLLLMPAWQPRGPLGVKVVTVFPDNATKGMPSVQGVYLVLDGASGAPLAVIDGPSLTRKRTAAVSALAAAYLAHRGASRLLMVGTGSLASELIAAHGTVRPIREVGVWGRTPDKARALAQRLSTPGRPVRAAPDLEAAVREADVIACATLSEEPLIRGAWLKPGAHLDLVGAFRPEMREADDEAARRARIYVDSRAGALKEAGDLLAPLRSGAIGQEDILGELAELARGQVAARESEAEITLFKSTGTALADYAAARLVLERDTRAGEQS